MTEIVPTVLERIQRTLVGLKMPRALEALDQAVRQLERGEASALEVIDTLLAEELTLRENRRIKTALVMARLSTIKTLAGFDFTFQPSLDRGRILALAQLDFIDRNEVVHFLGPPGTGKSHLATALGVDGQGGAQRLLCHPRRHHRDARQGRARRPAPGTHPLPLPRHSAHRRRDRLSASRPRRRQSLLPARQRPLRARRHDPYLKPRLRRMGRGLR